MLRHSEMGQVTNVLQVPEVSPFLQVPASVGLVRGAAQTFSIPPVAITIY